MAAASNDSHTERILDSELGLRTVVSGVDVSGELGKRLFRRRIYRMLLKRGILTVEPQLLRDLRHISDFVRRAGRMSRLAAF